jgi:ABC-type multidrug transport system fused ATPase/permease subunit
MAGRTVLVVAHRLSTIRDANMIVVFKQGKVVEKGSHKELIANTSGFYSELVAGQMTGH